MSTPFITSCPGALAVYMGPVTLGVQVCVMQLRQRFGGPVVALPEAYSACVALMPTRCCMDQTTPVFGQKHPLLRSCKRRVAFECVLRTLRGTAAVHRPYSQPDDSV